MCTDKKQVVKPVTPAFKNLSSNFMPVSQTEEMVLCFGRQPTPAKACQNLVAVDLGTVFFPEGLVAETGSTRSLAAGLLSGCLGGYISLPGQEGPWRNWASLSLWASPHIFLGRCSHFPHGGLGLPGAQGRNHLSFQGAAMVLCPPPHTQSEL